MKKIDCREWTLFKVGDLFTLDKPKPRSKSKYEKGKMPFVASGNYNNGVECYVKPKDNKDFDKGNCLTVSPVDGCTFYQFNDFLGRGGAGSSIIILRNSNLNKLNGLFLSTIINKQLSKFNYSNMGNQTIIKSEIISLPADNNGNPDWEYMEEYITNIENKARKKIKCLSQCRDDI